MKRIVSFLLTAVLFCGAVCANEKTPEMGKEEQITDFSPERQKGFFPCIIPGIKREKTPLRAIGALLKKNALRIDRSSKEKGFFPCIIPGIKREKGFFPCIIPGIKREKGFFPCIIPGIKREKGFFPCIIPGIKREKGVRTPRTMTKKSVLKIDRRSKGKGFFPCVIPGKIDISSRKYKKTASGGAKFRKPCKKITPPIFIAGSFIVPEGRNDMKDFQLEGKGDGYSFVARGKENSTVEVVITFDEQKKLVSFTTDGQESKDEKFKITSKNSDPENSVRVAIPATRHAKAFSFIAALE